MDVELYKYMFSHYWKLLVTITILVVMVSWLLVVNKSVQYQGSAYLSAAQQNQAQPDTDFYQYDQFYTLQGSGFLARLLESWLKDPATVKQIFDNEQLGDKIQGLNLLQLSKLLKPEVKGNNSLQIYYADRDRETVGKILGEAQNILRQRLEQYQNQGFYQSFTLISSEPLVIEDKINPNLYLLLSLIGGLVLSFVILLIITVFKYPSKGV